MVREAEKRVKKLIRRPACERGRNLSRMRSLLYLRYCNNRRNDVPRCAVCGWGLRLKPLWQDGGPQWTYVVEHHHILPWNRGGDESPSNLIDLCPNHHRVADIITGIGRVHRAWTRETLIEALREIDQDAEAWFVRMENNLADEAANMVAESLK